MPWIPPSALLPSSKNEENPGILAPCHLFLLKNGREECIMNEGAEETDGKCILGAADVTMPEPTERSKGEISPWCV